MPSLPDRTPQTSQSQTSQSYHNDASGAFSRESSQGETQSGTQGETQDQGTSDYERPRLKPLGTLPASTGMPVSNFGLGTQPER